MESPINRVPGTRVPLPKTMTCPLCQTDHKVRGHYRHLKTCLPRQGIDFPEYERLYPSVSYSPAHAFAIQWMRLANFSLTRFGLGDYHGCDWFHINTSSNQDGYYGAIPARDGQPEHRYRRPESKPLLAYRDHQLDLRHSFYQFGDHLRGDFPLAIWPDLDNRFLVIDLDGRQTQHLDALLERLVARGLQYHLEFSGSKGYHVWIFFKRVVSNAALIALYDELCDGLDTDRNVWPFRQGLIKLPLGLHPVTRNLAGFLRSPFIPIPLTDQLSYFLAIQPVDFPADVRVERRTIIPMPSIARRRSRRPRGTKGSMPEWRLSDQECEEAIQTSSRPADLSRYRLLFRLAAYLKQVEHRNEAECGEILLAWSSHVSKTKQRTLAYDVERQVRAVYFLNAKLAAGEVPALAGHQQEWIAQHVENVLIDHVAAGHKLDRHQLPQARDALTRLASYLVQLILWRGDRAYASFTGMASKTGLGRNRIDKWLPLLCGDTEEIKSSDAPSRYTGKLLLRASMASFDQSLAQEYVFTETAGHALRSEVVPAA